jgi:alkylation response protein AidB-like acyl-CoA dehydrogenase
VALEAIQALGGNGYINDYPTGRLCCAMPSSTRSAPVTAKSAAC